MGRHRGRSFIRDFADGYNVTRGVLLDYGMSKAADVNPETVEEVGDYTKTMGLTGADEQARMLQEQDAAFGAEGARSTAAALNANIADQTPAAGMVKTNYRMGKQTQDAPFSQEQIDAQRFRNQADVASRFGMAGQAAQLQGLAKSREEEHVGNQIRLGAGMKTTKDMRDEEKAFSMSKGMYETALRMNRPDLAQGYYQQMLQNRDVLLAKANERADRVYRATGNIGGYVDVYNRYLADGMTIDAFKANSDGSLVLTVNDDNKARDIVVPKGKVGDYLLALRDPKRVQEIEQKRAELLFKAQADAQEALNKPVAIGKDQTLVVPSTGQTFAPGANRGFDPKEANSVLDDVRTIFRDKYGIERDPTTGMPKDPMAKSAWTDQAISKANLAERVFMKNPGLPPAMLAEIADKGQTGTAVVEIGGKQQRVPAVSFNGRTYLLGGSDAGMQAAPAPAAAPRDPQGLGTRDVRGKIGGMSRAEGFPKVSATDQAARDTEAGKLLVAESGGVEQANRDLADIDAELANPRLDGTQRGILQGHRNRLAAGIAASS